MERHADPTEKLAEGRSISAVKAELRSQSKELEELRSRFRSKFGQGDGQAGASGGAASGRRQRATKEVREKNAKYPLFEHLTPAQLASCEATFRQCFPMKENIETDVVTADELCAMSTSVRHLKPLNEVEAQEMILRLDDDGDGAMNFQEFSRWWCATHSPTPSSAIMRVLLQAQMSHQDAERRFSRALAEHPTVMFHPKVDIHYEAIVGDDSRSNTEAGDAEQSSKKAGSVLLSVVPSTADQLGEAVKEAFASVTAYAEETGAAADDEDLVDENDFAASLPKRVENNDVPLLATIRLQVKSTIGTTDYEGDADGEEDLETAVEMLQSLFQEYNAQQETPIDTKLAVENDNDAGGRCIVIYIFVRRMSSRAFDDSDDDIDFSSDADDEGITDDPVGLLKSVFGEDPAAKLLARYGVPQDAAIFERVLVGLDFKDLSPLHVSSGGNKPLISVLNGLRAVAHASISEAAPQLLDAAAFHQIFKEMSSAIPISMLPMLLASRTLQSFDSHTEFRSPLELIDSTIDEICQMPVAEAKRMREAGLKHITDEDLRVLQAESERLRLILTAFINRGTPFHARAKDIIGHQKLKKVIGSGAAAKNNDVDDKEDDDEEACVEAEDGTRIALPSVNLPIVGPPKSGKTALFRSLVSPSSGRKKTSSSSSRLHGNSKVQLYDLPTNATSSIVGMSAKNLICLIDCSSKDTLEHSVALAQAAALAVLSTVKFTEDAPFKLLAVLSHLQNGNGNACSSASANPCRETCVARVMSAFCDDVVGIKSSTERPRADQPTPLVETTGGNQYADSPNAVTKVFCYKIVTSPAYITQPWDDAEEVEHRTPLSWIASSSSPSSSTAPDAAAAADVEECEERKPKKAKKKKLMEDSSDDDYDTMDSDDDDDDDDDMSEEEDGVGNQLFETIAFALKKVVANISEVTVVTRLIDASLALENAPIMGLLPDSKKELLEAQVEGRGSILGFRKSKAKLKNVALFDELTTIQKLSEIQKRIAAKYVYCMSRDGDSDDDDDQSSTSKISSSSCNSSSDDSAAEQKRAARHQQLRGLRVDSPKLRLVRQRESKGVPQPTRLRRIRVAHRRGSGSSSSSDVSYGSDEEDEDEEEEDEEDIDDIDDTGSDETPGQGSDDVKDTPVDEDPSGSWTSDEEETVVKMKKEKPAARKAASSGKAAKKKSKKK